jgi:hypothetical protein
MAHSTLHLRLYRKALLSQGYTSIGPKKGTAGYRAVKREYKKLIALMNKSVRRIPGKKRAARK